MHHGAHAVGQRARLGDRFVLEQLRHHRRRSLTDRAAPANEAHILDHLAVDAQLQVDFVPAQRIVEGDRMRGALQDRKSTRLNSSHMSISYAVFCLKKKKKKKKKIIKNKKKK